MRYIAQSSGRTVLIRIPFGGSSSGAGGISPYYSNIVFLHMTANGRVKSNYWGSSGAHGGRVNRKLSLGVRSFWVGCR